MIGSKLARAGLAAVALGAWPAQANEDVAAVESLMREYVQLWSGGDAAAIASRIYRMEPYDEEAQRIRVEGQIAYLREQGYSHSVENALEVCMLTDNQALVELRFTRYLEDGSPMPPERRATAYLVRRYDEGWRITNLIGMNASADVDCTSYEPAPVDASAEG